MRRFRAAVALVIACPAAAACVGMASAWACTPAANISASPETGPPDAEVAVEVKLFEPRQVELRWNSNDGPLLGTGTGPNFAKLVRVPADAKPGPVSTIVAIQRNAGGAIQWRTVTTYQVTAAKAAGPDAEGEANMSTSGETPADAPSPSVPPGTVRDEPDQQGAPASAPSASPSPRVTPSPGSRSLEPGVATGAVVGLPVPAPGAGGSGALLGEPGGQGSGAGEPSARAAEALAPVPEPWAPEDSSDEAPSLFEPTDEGDRRRGGGLPIGAALLGLGLTAIVGLGAVAGQRRLAPSPKR